MQRFYETLAMILTAAVIAGFTSTGGPSAQEVAVETKLVAGDGVDGDNFGAGIAIDGDVMAVAAPWADVGGVETSGAVYVFLRDPASGGWVEHQHLLPANGDFGDSFLDLTLAVDGDTIAVGAPYQTIRDFQEGAVYVFERDQAGPGLWGEVARLADVSVDHGGHFGSGVALEGDLLVVGAAQDSSSRNGWVRIFERDRGGPDAWGEVTTLAHSAVGDAGNPRSFGIAVALEGDLLVVGASRTAVSWAGESDGAAYLFRRSDDDPDRWDHVARLIAPGADQCAGGLPVSQFLLEATVEEREAAAACALDNRGASGAFGHRVALEGDTIVVTARFAPGDDDSYSVGRAHVFQRDPNEADVWQYVAPLAASDGVPFAYFGSALDLAGDRVLIGAPGTAIDGRSRQGEAYLFERTAGSPDAWGEVEHLLAYDGLSEAQFGAAVGFDGTATIIGARGDSTYRGAIYIEPPPEPRDVPPFVATGTLTDGGVVGADEGALLGAPEGALAAPVDVAISVTDQPEEPLEELQPVGDYVLVAAETAVLAPADKPFLVGLPLPDGHDGSNLVAAVLVAAGQILDGPESGAVWSLTRGSLDPASGLYVVPLSALDPDPSIMVLVNAPADEPAGDSVRTFAQLTADGYDFFLMCRILPLLFPGCNASKQLIHDAFVAAYDDFVVGKGYPPPHLNAWVGNFPLAPELPYVEWGRVLGTIVITPRDIPPCSPEEGPREAGHYNPNNFNISICVDKFTGSLDGSAPVPKLFDRVVETIRHELFHAIQHSYVNVREADRDGDRKWTIEGTAASVQNPAGSLTRALKWPSRPIDQSMVDESDYTEYETQDFWVYFGRQRELGREYLKGMFENGVDTYDADLLFAKDYQTLLGLEYWAWTKNQAIEKTFDYDGQLLNPCHIETALIGMPQVLMYPPVDASPVVEGVLDRLTSAVVKIEFRRETGPIRVSADQVADLRYKVYLDGEDAVVDGTPACVSVAEDAPRTFNETPDQPVYVLLSNVLHPPGSQVRYTVRVEPATDGE